MKVIAGERKAVMSKEGIRPLRHPQDKPLLKRRPTLILNSSFRVGQEKLERPQKQRKNCYNMRIFLGGILLVDLLSVVY